jgi:3-oxoadipate enol-lactonase
LFEWLAALNPVLPPGPDVAEAPVRPESVPQHTLFIAGSDDEVVPAQVVKGAAESVPHSRFETIPESGHSPYFERASVYNHIVEQFLEE